MVGRPFRILILFSDTGGGHRSAAEALIEAWRAEHPGRVDPVMVDVFKDHTPFPFSKFGPSYPRLVKHASRLYAGAYRATDSPRRARILGRALSGYVQPHLRKMLETHPADAIVSVHPLFNHNVNWTMRQMGLCVPFVTVVTDLLTAHAYWFYPHVTHLIVPTEGARQRALACGVPQSGITVRGLPVARKFTEALRNVPSKLAVRKKLGLSRDGRVVLLVGGGDGMGPLEATAHAIDRVLRDEARKTQLVVVTGRNAALRTSLQAFPWQRPVRVEGFVTNMPEWMAAADVLVTKAGPGTIIEGLLSGLPIVLIGKVPGQEDGNVDYVVQNAVGAWEPSPLGAAARIADWLRLDNPLLAAMSEKARGLADPNAASDIASDILTLTGSREPDLMPVLA
jgi:1,2-diacylglycerol 3-beta-galactosyltransferase